MNHVTEGPKKLSRSVASLGTIQSYLSFEFWTFKYCICYNPTALRGYKTQSKATKYWQGQGCCQVLTPNIDKSPDILSFFSFLDYEINNLCQVDVLCQSNAFVCLFVCWNETRKTILRLLCWEGMPSQTVLTTKKQWIFETEINHVSLFLLSLY